jgi:Helix-turn-helix domain
VRRYDAILRATSERATERLQELAPAEREKKQHETIRRFGGVIEPLDLTVTKKTSKSEKIPTQDETMILVSQGLSIEEIASRRNLKSSTIVSHIEKLIESKQDIDLSKFRPANDIYDPIRRAFVTLGTTGLSPVREYLLDVEDREYDYDQIRLVRLCLPTSDRKKIEEAMLYASE